VCHKVVLKSISIDVKSLFLELIELDFRSAFQHHDRGCEFFRTIANGRAKTDHRAYWMLPRGPVANMVALVEDGGGIVVPSRFGTNLLDGLSFRSEGMPPLFFMKQRNDRRSFQIVLGP
jgi:hypothetical protein